MRQGGAQAAAAAKEQLLAAYESGQLGKAVGEMAAQRAEQGASQRSPIKHRPLPDLPAEAVVSNLSAIELAPARCRAAVPPLDAQALVERLSRADRRIGLLRTAIQDVKHRVQARDEHRARIEAHIAAARSDMERTVVEIHHTQRAIGETEALQFELLQKQRKLVDKLDVEVLKQRHAAVDLNPVPALAGFFQGPSASASRGVW
mmetsp:Transcript_133226/g.371387  ORF Transcript_133226/g.371387 Transcript_133226/m.371387 type:complete len:204 (+) Transcript_133226:118-729(+)